MANDPLETLRQQAQEALARGHNQEARQIYQQALGYQSDSPEIHYGIATVCFLLGDLHSSVYHFKEVTRLDPLRAAAYINLGAVYNRLEQYDEALTTLRRGIQLDNTRAEGYYNLALVYKQLGQFEMAVNAYREALRLNPRMYDAHYNLGNIFRERQQFGMALAHYRHALEIRPKWEKGQRALEATQLEQAAAAESDAAAHTPSPAPPVRDASIDPNRLLEPTQHGKVLRELHEVVVDADLRSQAMLEFLQKEAEAAIHDLSIGILTPKDAKYSLDDQIRRFDDAVVELQKLQEALQKRMLRAKVLSEQIT